MRVLLLLVLALCAWSHPQVSHFVVLMMENRAFDHMLGTVEGVEGPPEGWENCDQKDRCFEVNSRSQNVASMDPPHQFTAQQVQIYGSILGKKGDEVRMKGFVKAAAAFKASPSDKDLATVMSQFNMSSAPVIHTLAREFGVIDRWFAAGPLPTDPNRAFAMSGTTAGYTTNYNGTHWKQQSYFKFLSKHGVSWNAYYDEDVWALGYFEDLQTSRNVRSIKSFLDGSDDLASFTWLQPSLNAYDRPPNWQHPDAPVSEGERLMGQVYERLRKDPAWNRTVLVICYDEHGGFSDHVHPPQNVPRPDGITAANGYQFDTLGVRLPAVIISPLIPKGLVVSKTRGPTPTSEFDGTSSIATATKIFGIKESITRRVAWSGTFEWMLSLKEPRHTPLKMPKVPMWTVEDLRRQRAQPLNEHMSNSLLFYCHELSVPNCPNPELINQGEASDFMTPLMALYHQKRLA